MHLGSTLYQQGGDAAFSESGERRLKINLVSRTAGNHICADVPQRLSATAVDMGGSSAQEDGPLRGQQLGRDWCAQRRIQDHFERVVRSLYSTW